MSRHKTRNRGDKADFNIVPYRHAAPHQGGSSPAQAATNQQGGSSSRFLFVEVHGPHRKHRQALRYDRSTQELKSHVMLVTSERKRKKLAANENEEEEAAADRLQLSRPPPPDSTGIISDIDTHLVDPFNVLPVESSPVLHEAMRYFFENYPGPTPMTDDVFVCDRNRYQRERVRWSNTEYHLCYGEPAGYYITLFVYDILQSLARSADSLSVTASKYMAWTIRAVREGMPKEDQDVNDITDSFVATVGGLSVVEVFIGHWQEAESHLNGMLALVAARGGIFTFSHLAQRTIKWIEYLCCAANATAPVLPALPLMPFPAELEEMARSAYRRSMALLPPQFDPDADRDDDDYDDDYEDIDGDVISGEADYAPLTTILRELHEVSLGSTLFRGKAVAAALDDVEHRLLDELIRRQQQHQQQHWQSSSPFSSPASAAAAAPAGSGGSSVAAVSVDTVYDALLQAAHMYVWAALNPGPKEMAANGVFVRRLQEVLLQEANEDADVPGEMQLQLVERWSETAPVESLLWVLVIGWGVASQQKGDVRSAIERAMWYAGHVFRAMEVVGVQSEEELAEALKAFPWVDAFCKGPCGVLWDMYVRRKILGGQFQS